MQPFRFKETTSRNASLLWVCSMGADPIAEGDGDYRDYPGSRLQHLVAATELRSGYHAPRASGLVEKWAVIPARRADCMS